jgi:hypothetical protein
MTPDKPDLERLIERLRELDSHEYIKHCVCVEDIDISDRFIESAAALETLSARVSQAEQIATAAEACMRLEQDIASAALERAAKAEQAAEELRKDAERLDWVERNLCRAEEVTDKSGRFVGIMKCWQVVTQCDDSLRDTVDTLRAALAGKEGKS